jgi:transposase-like protein
MPYLYDPKLGNPVSGHECPNCGSENIFIIPANFYYGTLDGAHLHFDSFLRCKVCNKDSEETDKRPLKDQWLKTKVCE